jgi:hypothetical protein
MKKTLRSIMLTAFVAGISTSAFAQTEPVTKTLATQHPPIHMGGGQALRSTACGTDTIFYPEYKEYVFNAPNDTNYYDMMVGTVRTASQTYKVSDTIMVRGVQFFGGAYLGAAGVPITAKVYLYTVNPTTNQPLVAIDSATTVIGGLNNYNAMFTVPHMVSTNFAVAVKNNTPNDSIYVFTNNAGSGPWQVPQYGENLGWRRFGSGAWNSNLSFFGQDLEYLVYPIVSYDLQVSFTASNDTVCPGDIVSFTNTSSGVINDRMFNLYKFNTYFLGEPDSSYFWTFRNGSYGFFNQSSTTYTMPGTYQPTLFGNRLGYYNFCRDSAFVNIFVQTPSNSAFTVNNTLDPVISVNSTATNADSVRYDYGDGTGWTSATSHMYTSNGTYTVWQVAYGPCGTDSSSTTVMIIEVGFVDLKMNSIKAIYHGDNHSMTIDMPASGSIQVYDMIGKNVIEQKLGSRTSVVNLSTLQEGSYIAKITMGDAVKTIRFVLVK